MESGIGGTSVGFSGWRLQCTRYHALWKRPRRKVEKHSNHELAPSPPCDRLSGGFVILQADGRKTCAWRLVQRCAKLFGTFFATNALYLSTRPLRPLSVSWPMFVSCPLSAPPCRSRCSPTLSFTLHVLSPPAPPPLYTPVLFYSPPSFCPRCLCPSLCCLSLSLLPCRFSSHFQEYSATSFTQANKSDAKATGACTGVGSSEKAFASTTRQRGYGGWLVSWSCCLLNPAARVLVCYVAVRSLCG